MNRVLLTFGAVLLSAVVSAQTGDRKAQTAAEDGNKPGCCDHCRKARQGQGNQHRHGKSHTGGHHHGQDEASRQKQAEPKK